MTSAVALIGLAISLLTTIVAVTAVIVQMRTNVDALKKNGEAQDKRESDAAVQVTELLVLLKSFISAQTQINKTVELGLAGVVEQLREMDKRTAESSSIVSLLAELLGKKQVSISGMNIQP